MSDCRQRTKSLAEFAPAGAKKLRTMMGRNSFLPHHTVHEAYCASKASAGSGVQLARIGARQGGPDSKRVDFVDTLKMSGPAAV